MDGDYYDRDYDDRNNDPDAYWDRYKHRPYYHTPHLAGSRLVNLLVDALVDLTVGPRVWTFWFYEKLAILVSTLHRILAFLLRFILGTLHEAITLWLNFWLKFVVAPIGLCTLWISLCACVHFVDWYQGANGLLARQFFDFVNPASQLWAVSAGQFAPYLRLAVDAIYPFSIVWTAAFPIALDAATGT